MYCFTLGQFQLYSLGNSDEDWLNNALRLRLRGQVNKRISLKLAVGVTVTSLKLQISFCQDSR